MRPDEPSTNDHLSSGSDLPSRSDQPLEAVIAAFRYSERRRARRRNRLTTKLVTPAESVVRDAVATRGPELTS